ncbi:MAG: M23 family metallopeptidase [Myxococcales bacterium]|nr:M23 family metallopeptidase [Myxococcales bacterium]
MTKRIPQLLGIALGLSLALGPATGLAQTRHRRPIDPAPALSYHFDNNGGAGGCSDYNCGGRCYDGHSGTDMPVPLGTTVRASADGVVIATNNGCANYGSVGNTCGGRCGNYVQLQHADGTRSIYCHMMLDSIAVSRGQNVGCGAVLGRSASSGSSSGPHLHFGWSSGGVSRDPFNGRCSGARNVWTVQNAYPASPGADCEGPPPPPPCISRVGPFGWNCAGPIAGMTCTQIAEPSDPHTWTDNYFCSDSDRQLRFSNAGPIAGMNCTQIAESSEPAAHTWTDNFLCAPTWLPYRFAWSSAGPIAGMQCINWAEPGDPHTWNDNFLCWQKDTNCLRRSGPFAWSCAGPVAGMECVALAESAEPAEHTWPDNFVCGPAGIGLRFSSAGPIADMDCTALAEGSDPHTWGDNFLCLPRGSGYTLRWSSAGPIAGANCLQIYEPSDPHTWEDNFLCWSGGPVVSDAGAPSDAAETDASSATDSGNADGGTSFDASVPTPIDGSTGADAGMRDALPPIEEVWIEEHPPIQGGCGCRAASSTHNQRAPIAIASLIALSAVASRRKQRARR